MEFTCKRVDILHNICGNDRTNNGDLKYLGGYQPEPTNLAVSLLHIV